MKAIVIREYGGPDVLELRDVPEPLGGSEDVVVAVKAVALNRADLLQRRGLYPQPGPKPGVEIPGLEFAGEVVDSGERSEGFAAGDRVMGILVGGGYAERVVVNHRLVTRVPDALSWREAAAVPEAFITAHDALCQCRLVVGESVLIHAVGSGVGAAAVQVARLIGASPVIGTAGSAAKLESARDLGLEVGIPYRDKDFAEETLAATAGRGADVVVDFIGGSYLGRNLEALALKGRLIVIGMLGGIKGELDLAMLLAKRLEIRGTLLRSRSLEEKAAATRAFEKSILPALVSGRVSPVVDRVFPIESAGEAHSYMETNANFGKIILEF